MRCECRSSATCPACLGLARSGVPTDAAVRLREVEAENERLKKLVRDMWPFIGWYPSRETHEDIDRRVEELLGEEYFETH